MFLGLKKINWQEVLKSISGLIKPGSVAFAILSELQLCTIRSTIRFPRENDARHFEHWLYNQYCRYAIRVNDYDEVPKQYNIPLIEAFAIPSSGTNGLETAPANAISTMMPQHNQGLRLILFPQTRFSFIQDEVRH